MSSLGLCVFVRRIVCLRVRPQATKSSLGIPLGAILHDLSTQQTDVSAHTHARANTYMPLYTQSGSLMNPCQFKRNKGWRGRAEGRGADEWRAWRRRLRVEVRGNKAGRHGGVLPGLFGLEIDRLSLSPNLSISSTHPHAQTPPSIPLWCRKV